MAAEFGAAAVSSIVSEGAKSLFQLIKREISYVFKYQSNMDGLKNQVKELENRKEMVKKPVELALGRGDEIYKGVEDWLNSIDDFAEKVAKPITGAEDEAKQCCFKGLRLNLFKRYNLSKKAAKAAKEGVDLFGRGNFSTVSCRPGARDLERKVRDLEFLRKRVEKEVEHAKTQGDEIFDDVEDWFIRVKNFSDKAVNALEEVDDLLNKGNFSTVSCRPGARDLKRKVRELEFLRQRVEKEVEHAKTQGDEIFDDVKYWLILVKDFNDKAVNAAEEVGNLLRKGNFTNVSYRPVLEKTEFMQVRGYEQFDSRMKVFQDVMEALNDSNVDMIGVYGMGGVGKTTLVKQVARKVMEDKLFDKVVMAELTQTPDHMEIQNKIANGLGMKFELNESVLDRADRLCERMKKEKRVLVVLDNIWKKLEFGDVGIPFENDKKERWCTIILTSRRLDLLSNQMNSQKNFSIEVLSKNEAWQLFGKIVGDSAKQSDLKAIADEIVERCGGLPVALSTVANALKNMRLEIWKDALNQLRSFNRREIPEMDANVYSSIELSYNFLESDEAKSLFLLCGLFGEGHPIRVVYLIRYGMGLGLFKNIYALEGGRSRVHTLIDNLKTSCLLLDGDVEDEVKMHDIIHVVAVSIAAEKLMFDITNAEKLKKEIEKIKQKGPNAISLSCKKDVYDLPEQLECPQLKLLLFTKGDSSRPIIPDLFFEGMKELKVLHLDDIRCVPSLPSSLGCLINLQTLCLESCNLEDIAIVGQLKNLEILSFRNSHIQQLPLEIGQLTGLQLLDLSGCWGLQVIAPNVISSLSRLEELYMMDSFTGWEKAEGGKNASLVELKRLSELTTLEISIPNAETISQDWVSVELERYKIFIGNTYFFFVGFEPSRMMRLEGLEESILLGMKMLFNKSEYLYLKKLAGFPNVVHELDDKEGFPLLKYFHIKGCSDILYIVNSVGRVHCEVFPLLELLFLDNLINLEKVWQGQLVDNQSFSNLRFIKVKKCVNLKHLFSFSMTKNLLLLQKVKVRNCKNLETIVGLYMEKSKTILEIKEIIAEDHLHEKVIFPSLEELELKSLPKLTSFTMGVKSVEFSTSTWEENRHSLFHEKVGHHQLSADSFRKLKKLDIYKCDGLTSIFPPMVIFPNLEELKIRNCRRLKYLLSYSMVNNLARLQHLEVTVCEAMEVVIGRDEGKLIEMVFPKLHYLELSYLPNLTSFVMEINSVEFPSLQLLKIRHCSNLRNIISTSSSENNNQPLLDEKVALPNLMTLKVSNCNGLRSLTTLSIAESMVNLTTMQIWFCEKMEEIIQEQFGEEKLKKDLMVFSQLQDLELVHLPSLTCFCLGKLYTLEFSSLERVYVSACPNMKTFSQGVLVTPILHEVHYGGRNCWEGDLNSTIQKMFKEMVGFRKIWSLELSLFPSLRKIWHGQELPVGLFNNLKYLVVDDCMDMSSAISISLLRCLNNLERLKVCNCVSLEEVFHLEELNVYEYFWPIFLKLEKLELINLPKLQRFCNFIGNIIELPSLLYLWIENCPIMEAFISNSTSVHMTANNKPQEMTLEENFMLADIQPFFDEKVEFPRLTELKLSRLPKLLHLWKENSQASKAFRKLTTLEVSKCDGLINMATLSAAESMVNLESLKITDSKMIQEIIQVVGEEVEDSIVFENLKYLGLDGLPRLISFCLGNYTLEFPSLKQVLVRECPNMKSFPREVLLLEEEEEEVEDDDDDDDDDDYDSD